MSLPQSLMPLLDAGSYPHPCRGIDVVETHISWVIRTGELVYKIKKPVQFSFLDFSTLARRRHFCEEELRCNRRFAPSLYLDVVAITRRGHGLAVGGNGEPVEWAVKMRQFPADAELDEMLERHALTQQMLRDFGATLAAQHGGLPGRRLAATELESRVLAPVRDNFRDLAGVRWLDHQRGLLDRVRADSEALAGRLRPRLEERLEAGCTRECHGDLHLANLVALDDGVRAFDCLEFDPDLRWIDPMSDVAFLFMDCLVRGRTDLGYAFVDGYFDACGDYEGMRLLGFYAVYRAMVRAKVAALRRDQASGPEAERLARRAEAHIRWAAERLRRPVGRVVLMCGLSASGKSHLAGALAPRLPALRLRSDVARKVRAGLDPRTAAGTGVGRGLYTPAQSREVYRWLAELAAGLAAAGEHVIVDATFLEAARRQPFIEAAAAAGASLTILCCEAPIDLLEQRLRERAARGDDPSDADLAVLAEQRRRFEPPQSQVIRVDTSVPVDESSLAAWTIALDPTSAPDRAR